MTIPQWKGKARDLRLRQSTEGDGGPDGIVLPLSIVGSGVYDVAYVLPIKVGKNAQTFSLQVDTGSSDLWIASTSCSTSSCSQSSSHLYNPSTSSTSTGVDFSIKYLQGDVQGPIVWDTVSVGGYTIDSQALAAASTVDNEPLSSNFNGILGLALPLNSVIANLIPPVTGNSPDGAAWASNLFSITPTTSAASARFLSLALSRPGSNRVPAVLGIGRHPTELVSDPSQIRYSTLVSEKEGTLFWKVSVRAITVYVGGVAMPVDVGRSNTGAVFPSAVIDSGVPLILTTSSIANAIYGAIGVSPASDGNYYVPCTTPLNLTITVDDRPPIPLHPLDLTSEPPNGNQAQFCTGLIQADNGALSQANNKIGDMILGVPFMRNVYTVMAYTQPNPDGSFGSPSLSSTMVAASLSSIQPRLGFMNLTDPTVALQEFHTVRVLNQPIPSSTPGPGGGTSSSYHGSSMDTGKKLSVGIIVLVGLLGFFAVCLGMFGVRWFVVKRRWKRERDQERAKEVKGGYQLADMPSEDRLREMRYEAYMNKEQRIKSGSTMSSAQTRVGVGVDEVGKKLGDDDEPGLGSADRVSRVLSDEDIDIWDPKTALAWGDDTLVGRDRTSKAGDAPGTIPSQHIRSDSEFGLMAGHQRGMSSSFPLLGYEAHPHHHHQPSNDFPAADVREDFPTLSELDHRAGGAGEEEVDEGANEGVDEFGMGVGGGGMAGVGTASRTSKIDVAFRDSIASMGSARTVVSRGGGERWTVGHGLSMGSRDFSP